MDQRPGTPGRLVRRWIDATAIVVGLVVLVAGMAVVHDGRVPGWERDVFEVINGWPDALQLLFAPVQQLGALVVGPVVALVALWRRHRRLAVAALLVTVGKLVTERLVKALVTRARPFTSIGPEVTTRGEVPHAGESFVSGHAVLVTALAGVVTPYLHGRWKLAPWTIVILVGLGRVYVGAHNPLDVVGGTGLGLIVAGLANLAIGVPPARPAG